MEIARILALNEDGNRSIHTIFFDEPFAGLSQEMIKIVSEILLFLKKEGKTVVFIEHNMDIIRELSDHVVVFNNGKVTTEGNPHEVFLNPLVIEAYLGK